MRNDSWVFFGLWMAVIVVSVFIYYLILEQSRRDDMEALGYILLYFLNGSLPWQGIHAKTNLQKYEKITEKKLSIPVEELCKGAPGKRFQHHLSKLPWIISRCVCNLPKLCQIPSFWRKARLPLSEATFSNFVPPSRVFLWLCIWLEHSEECKYICVRIFYIWHENPRNLSNFVHFSLLGVRQ